MNTKPSHGPIHYYYIGKPVSHSKSLILYNGAIKNVGFNGVYVHLLVDDVSSFLKTYSSVDFAGFSVTIPHKEAAVRCCDEVDPIAKGIGAVNYVIRNLSDVKIHGYNTDYVGAITSIENGLRGLVNFDNGPGSPLAKVYTPKITRLLSEAEEAGARTVSGLEMFIDLAYEQYERFTGLTSMVSRV